MCVFPIVEVPRFGRERGEALIQALVTACPSRFAAVHFPVVHSGVTALVAHAEQQFWSAVTCRELESQNVRSRSRKVNRPRLSNINGLSPVVSTDI
jgi:hypothetical protein